MRTKEFAGNDFEDIRVPVVYIHIERKTANTRPARRDLLKQTKVTGRGEDETDVEGKRIDRWKQLFVSGVGIIVNEVIGGFDMIAIRFKIQRKILEPFENKLMDINMSNNTMFTVNE